MKHHGIMYPMGELGVQSCMHMVPYVLGHRIPFVFFFCSWRTEEQQETVSRGFLVGLVLFQTQAPLHILLPYHSYTLSL